MIHRTKLSFYKTFICALFRTIYSIEILNFETTLKTETNRSNLNFRARCPGSCNKMTPLCHYQKSNQFCLANPWSSLQTKSILDFPYSIQIWLISAPGLKWLTLFRIHNRQNRRGSKQKEGTSPLVSDDTTT